METPRSPPGNLGVATLQPPRIDAYMLVIVSYFYSLAISVLFRSHPISSVFVSHLALLFSNILVTHWSVRHIPKKISRSRHSRSTISESFYSKPKYHLTFRNSFHYP